MKHAITRTLILLTAVLSFLVGFGSHIALIISGAEDSPLTRWRLVGLGLVALSSAALLLLRHLWRRQQTALNNAPQRRYSLAPRPAAERPACDFWRRAPGGYIKRGWLDMPVAHISLEIGGDQAQSFFSLVAPASLAADISGEVAREWPKVEIRPLADSAADIPPGLQGEWLVDMPQRGGAAWRWQTFTLKEPDYQPLHSVETRYGQPQPPSRLRGLLGAVDRTPAGVVSGVQLLVRPAPPSKRLSWGRRATLLRQQLANRGSHSNTRTQEGEGVSVRSATSRQYGPANADDLQRELTRITNRLADGDLYEVCLRVWACGDQERVGGFDVSSAERAAQRLGDALIAATRCPWNELEKERAGEDGAPVIGRHFPDGGGIIMTAGELGQLLHLPDQEEAAPYARLHTAGAEPLAPEGRIAVAAQETAVNERGELTPGRGRAVKRAYGLHSRSSGEDVLVGHSFGDATMHAFVVGATGAGKSVLGANLVLQDWLAGHAALVIDPHRALIDDILRGVPVEREGDVILLDPGDARQPFRWNLFDAGKGKETAVERLMSAIRVGMGASWDGSVGMQEVLHNALTLALHGRETPSFMTVMKLLDGSERAAWLKTMTETTPPVQQARAFWEKTFPSWNPQDQKRAEGAARRRIENFTRRGAVRRALGMAGTTVDLEAALNSGKLILCPMHNEMGEETKRIWSALLLQELIALLLARDPRADLPRVTVAIDELAESIGGLADFIRTLLNETRKYGAAVILMNQSYVTLPLESRQVIMGNCRSHIAFSLGAEDAEVAARVMGGMVEAADVQRLRPYRAYARLAVGGGQAAPCLLRALPPLQMRERLARLPKPEPPAGIVDKLTPMPERRDGTLSLGELVAWGMHTDMGDDAAVSALLATLQALPEERYAALCRLRQESDDWWAQQALATPGIVPDKVKRIRMASRLRYGIPWWQSDADYLRTVAGRNVMVTAATSASSGDVLVVDNPERF